MRDDTSSTAAGRDIEPSAVTRLAILVVFYLKDDEDLPLLQLHLERVERHTKVPYTLYAVANRVSPRARAMIASSPNVRMCDVPTTALRASREHGYYLDALVSIALADDVSHICTLDVDSFPIDDAWVDVLLRTAPSDSGLTGILRVENGDTALPHPSCIFARREFFDEYQPSFSPDSDYTPEFRQFLQTTDQAADTGIRVGYTLWQQRLTWGHLVRTNARNPHYLLAGIYGDVVFHLGGASRRVIFRQDFQHSKVLQFTRWIEHLPTKHRAVNAAQLAFVRWVRGDLGEFVLASNQATFDALFKYLAKDSDGFIDYLRGGRIPEMATGRTPANEGSAL
jgi:hypothetical protein